MQNSRNESIDLVKTIAMLGVICLHSTHQFIQPNSFGFADVLYETAVVSVPLFFITSGYLLLGRANTGFSYSVGKIAGIVRFVTLIVILHWVIMSVRFADFNIRSLPQTLINPYIQRGTFFMFWYLGAMIILYILYPYLNGLFLNRRHLFYVLILLVSIISFTTFITNILVWGGNCCISEPEICQTFRIWIWMLYFCLGGVMKLFKPGRIVFWVIPILLIVNVSVQEWLNKYIGMEACEYFYSSPYVILLSLSVFAGIIQLPITGNRVMTELSRLFLPVYTIHIYVISFVNQAAEFPDCWWSPLLFWIVASIIAIASASIMMKIPYMNRIFKI